MALGFFGKPGEGLNENTRALLGNMLSDPNAPGGALEMSLTGIDIPSGAHKTSLMNFFLDLIPKNIFSALSLGSTMAIVFFAIIFGFAIGTLKEKSALMLIDMLTAVFESFQKLINWSLYFLPFGLICLLAGQISKVGADIFMAMSKFIILFYVGGILVFLIATLVIWLKSGIRNPFKVLMALFDPVLISFATRNSMAALPSAISSLENKLNFNSVSVSLTLPLGMTMGRFGNILYFGLASFFVTQIYGVDLALTQYLIIFIGVIFAGTATAGASGIITLSVMSIILTPLGLPMEAVLIIFMAIDPVVDPMRTFVIVYVNTMISALVADLNTAHPEASGDKPAVDNQPGSFELPESPQKPALPDSNELHVLVSSENYKPFLNRDNSGAYKALEPAVLAELAHRINRTLTVETVPDPIKASLDPLGQTIIAGRIIREDIAPGGFAYSLPFASLNDNGKRKFLCLLVPVGNPLLPALNGAIKDLNAESFLKHFSEGKPAV